MDDMWKKIGVGLVVVATLLALSTPHAQADTRPSTKSPGGETFAFLASPPSFKVVLICFSAQLLSSADRCGLLGLRFGIACFLFPLQLCVSHPPSF